MIRLLVLTAWMLVGVGLSGLLHARSEPRCAWAPVAAVFGPLWLFIALDRRELLGNGPAEDPALSPAVRPAEPEPRPTSHHAPVLATVSQ